MLNNMGKIFGTVALVVSMGFASGADAAPVNGTGLVTPDVIFGSGNANGSWTGDNANGIEVALRGKLRFDLGGLPQNTFNYDGDRTYTFDPALSNAPANRSIFNFEYAVNVDSDGTTGNVLNDLTYVFQFDVDPTAGTNFVAFDPITGTFAITDNATGTNATANGAGADSPATYLARLLTDNVAQNSQNRGFGFDGGLGPQLEGIFTYNFLVQSTSGDELETLASTSIDIIVGAPSAVPLPAALPLFGTGLAVMGFVGWRRRKALAA